MKPYASWVCITASVALAWVLAETSSRQSRQAVKGETVADRREEDWFEHANDVILLVQAKEPYQIVRANPEAGRLLGYQEHELLRLTPMQLASEHTGLEQIRSLRNQLLEKQELIFEWSCLTKSGNAVPVEMSCRLIQREHEQLILAIARDITERKAMLQRLRDTEQIFDSLFEHNPSAIGVLNSSGSFARANAATERLLGLTAEELAGVPFLHVVDSDHQRTALLYMEGVREGLPQTFDTSVVHRTGYRIDLHMTAVPIVVETGTSGSIVICQDITERKRADEQNRYMAYYDDMTGLPNRRLFKEQLDKAICEAREHGYKIAVFALDLDRFNLVNDSFGYEYGNMLLLQVAERFTHCVTERDFLARTKGDEFALYFVNVEHSCDVLELVANIARVLEEPFLLDEIELHITASIGVALYTHEEEEAETLMKYADIALARVREKNGHNDFQIFNSDMKSVSLDRLKLENELRRAIACEEFVLYYQPQMDIETGHIVGMEALIRWNHPERGIVPPKDFIALAEETGLIVPIGEWVLREACKQNTAWQQRGFARVPISVNLSVRQFLQHNLKSKIQQVLEQTGLEPQYLELEITESMTMDVEHAITSLLELKELGVQVSIDDFGTGYSSLYYLKKFPIDKLKIDQSFVRDIMVDPNDAAIVTTIIAMTRHLNLKVIAEGVETEEQLHFLHANRCNEVQGYWFSPPLSVRQMEQMFVKFAQAASASEIKMNKDA